MAELPILHDGPVLWCSTCDREFPAIDVVLFRFDQRTMTCHLCQREQLDAPAPLSCFGKPASYDPDCAECSRLCPDREVCADYLENAMQKKIEYTEAMRENATRLFRRKTALERQTRKVKPSHPFPQQNSVIRLIWNMAVVGTTVKRIESFCAEIGGQSRYYLRKLRREYANGYEWKCEEGENGRLRIDGLQRRS